VLLHPERLQQRHHDVVYLLEDIDLVEKTDSRVIGKSKRI
jgi:hypothetical protein